MTDAEPGTRARRRLRITRTIIECDIYLRGLFAGRVACTWERTQGGKYHTNGGTGFAAEDAAERAYRHAGRHVILTGPNNEPNGPDLIVDGVKVQVKYFPNACSTMNAAFDKCGRYRYCGQQLEVPRDQYETCIELMRGRIREGHVDGVDDPGKAEAIVRCGPVTYKQARNIAKAGTVDSFCFDVETQAVLIPQTFVLSAGLDCVRSLWRGQRAPAAITKAVCNGVASSVHSLFTGVCTSQVLRTRTAAVVAVGVRSGVKTAASTQAGRRLVRYFATATLGKPVSGGAAINRSARVLRSSAAASAIGAGISVVPDFYKAAITRTISWTQFTKNVAVNAAGTGTGVGGWAAGVALGGALGSAVPIIGTAAGAMIGGLLGSLTGGEIGSVVARGVAELAGVEDDTTRMLRLLDDVLSKLSNDYLLTQAELERLITSASDLLSPPWLRAMYRSGTTGGRGDDGRRQFAYDQLEPICEEIVWQRASRALANAAALVFVGGLLLALLGAALM